MDAAANSEDSGTLQALKTMDSLETKINQVQVAYQQFYTTLGIESVWKGALDGIKNFINNLNGLPKVFGKIPVGAITILINAVRLIKALLFKAIGQIATVYNQQLKNQLAQATVNSEKQAKTMGERIAGAMVNGFKSKKNEAQVASQDIMATLAGKASNGVSGQALQGYYTRFTQLGANGSEEAYNTLATEMRNQGLGGTQIWESFDKGSIKARTAIGAVFSELLKVDNATVTAGEHATGFIQKFQSFSSGKLAAGIGYAGMALQTLSMTLDQTSEAGRIASGVLTGVGSVMSAIPMFSINPIMATVQVALGLINMISTIREDEEERIERLTKEAEDLNNKAVEAKANTKTLESGIKKVEELKEKRNESTEAAENYQNAVDDLAEAFPLLISGFNTAGEIMIDTTNAEELLAASRRESAQAAYEAAKGELKLQEEKRRQLEEDLSEQNDIIKGQFSSDTENLEYIRDAAVSPLSEINILKGRMETGIPELESAIIDYAETNDFEAFKNSLNNISIEGDNKGAADALAEIQNYVNNYSFEDAAEPVDEFTKRYFDIQDKMKALSEQENISVEELSAIAVEMETLRKDAAAAGRTDYANSFHEYVGENGSLVDYLKINKELMSSIKLNEAQQKKLISAELNTRDIDSLTNSDAIIRVATNWIYQLKQSSDYAGLSMEKFYDNAGGTIDEGLQQLDTFYNGLSEAQQKTFNEMVTDKEIYSAEAIIQKLGIEDGSIQDMIYQLYADDAKAIKDRMLKNLADNVGVVTSENRNTTATDELYKAYVAITNNGNAFVTKYSEQLLNNANDITKSYERQGMGGQSDAYGEAFLEMVTAITSVDDSLIPQADSLMKTLSNSELDSWSGINETIEAVKAMDTLDDSLKQNTIKNLEALRDAVVTSVNTELEYVKQEITDFYDNSYSDMLKAGKGINFSDALKIYDKMVNSGAEVGSFNEVFKLDASTPGQYILQSSEAISNYVNEETSAIQQHAKDVADIGNKAARGLSVLNNDNEAIGLRSSVESLRINFADSEKEYDEYISSLSEDQSAIMEFAANLGVTSEMEAYITAAEDDKKAAQKALLDAISKALDANLKLSEAITSQWENIANIETSQLLANMGDITGAIKTLTGGKIEVTQEDIANIIKRDSVTLERLGLDGISQSYAISYAEDVSEQLNQLKEDILTYGYEEAMANAGKYTALAGIDIGSIFQSDMSNEEIVKAALEYTNSSIEEANAELIDARKEDRKGVREAAQDALGAFEADKSMTTLFAESEEDIQALADAFEMSIEDISYYYNKEMGRYIININNATNQALRSNIEGVENSDQILRQAKLTRKESKTKEVEEIISTLTSDGLDAVKEQVAAGAYEITNNDYMQEAIANATTAMDVFKLVRNAAIKAGTWDVTDLNKATAQVAEYDQRTTGKVALEGLQNFNFLSGQTNSRLLFAVENLDDAAEFLGMYGIQLTDDMYEWSSDLNQYIVNVARNDNIAGFDAIKSIDGFQEQVVNSCSQYVTDVTSEYQSLFDESMRVGWDKAAANMGDFGKINQLLKSKYGEDVDIFQFTSIGDLALALGGLMGEAFDLTVEQINSMFSEQKAFDTKATTGAAREALNKLSYIGNDIFTASSFDDIEGLFTALDITLSDRMYHYDETLQAYVLDLSRLTPDERAAVQGISGYDKLINTGIREAATSLNDDFISLFNDILDKGMTDAIAGMDQYESLSGSKITARYGSRGAQRFLEAYGQSLVQSTEEYNDMLIQAIEYDKKNQFVAKDALKNMSIAGDGKTLVASSMDDLKDLANALGINLSSLVWDYSYELEAFTINLGDANNAKLAEGVNSVENSADLLKQSAYDLLEDIQNYFKDAILDGISFGDKQDFMSKLYQQFGTETIDNLNIQFEETADGFKLAQKSVYDIYNELVKVNSLAGKVALRNLAESARDADESLDNIFEVQKRINTLEDKINKAKPGTSREKQLKTELAIAKEIRAELEGEGGAFNFMDKDVPKGYENPMSAWEGMGEAFKVFETKEFKAGRMDFTDFYNMISQMEAAGVTLQTSAGAFEINAQNAAMLIEKASGALEMVDGESFVNLSNLGLDFELGAEGFKNGLTDGIHTLAQSQIDMLDAAIQMLDTIAAMEELGDIDTSGDGILNVDEIFGTNGQFTDDWSDKIVGIRKALTKAGVDLKGVHIAGLSLEELLTLNYTDLERLGISKEKYADLMTKLWQASSRTDWNPDDISSIFETWGQSLNEAFNFANDKMAIHISPSGEMFKVDFESEDFKERVKKVLGSDGEKKMEQAKTLVKQLTEGKNMSTENYHLALQLAGEIDVEESGEEPEYTYKGIKCGTGQKGLETAAFLYETSQQMEVDDIQIDSTTGEGTVTLRNGYKLQVVTTVDDEGNESHQYVASDGSIWSTPDELYNHEYELYRQDFFHKYGTTNGAMSRDDYIEMTFKVRPTITGELNTAATSQKRQELADLVLANTKEDGTVDVGAVKASFSDVGIEIADGASVSQDELLNLLGVETENKILSITTQADDLGTKALNLFGSENSEIPVTLKVTGLSSEGLTLGGTEGATLGDLGEINATASKVVITPAELVPAEGATTTLKYTDVTGSAVTVTITAQSHVDANQSPQLEAYTGTVTGTAESATINVATYNVNITNADGTTNSLVVNGTANLVAAIAGLTQSPEGGWTVSLNDGTFAIQVDNLTQIQEAIAALMEDETKTVHIEYDDPRQQPTVGVTSKTTAGYGIMDYSNGYPTLLGGKTYQTREQAVSNAQFAVDNGTITGEYTITEIDANGAPIDAANSTTNINGDIQAGSVNVTSSGTGNKNSGNEGGKTGVKTGGGSSGKTATTAPALDTSQMIATAQAGINQIGNKIAEGAKIGASSAKAAIQATLSSVKSKRISITGNAQLTANIKLNVTGGTGVAGKVTMSSGSMTINQSFAKGSIPRKRPAFASGTKALMGELGPELVVSGGQYYTVGENGPEFVNLADDAIVFNHLQTKKLLAGGKTSTYGTPITNERNAVSFAKGTAMASAAEAANQLRAIRAQWARLLEMTAKDFGKKAGSGGGGGGGGAEDKAVLGDLQRWYNLLRQIAHLEKEITLEQAKRENMASGGDYSRSLKNELAMLKEQKEAYTELTKLQKSWYDKRREDLNNSAYSKIFTYDERGLMQYVGQGIPGEKVGLDILATLNETDVNGKAKKTAKQQLQYLKDIGFDVSALDYNEDGTKASKAEDKMQNFWDTVDAWMEEMDGLYDEYHDHATKQEETLTKMNEIIQQYIDVQLDVEQQLLTAIEDREQAIIDKLQDEKEAIQNAADQYIEGLNSALQKEQDMYQKNQDQNETNRLQRQLAILQRSGGSASEIRSLQQQLDSRMKDDYFNKMQEQIDAVQEASDKQIERLDKQIELLSNALDYQKENGLLWNEVYMMLDTQTPQQIADFVATYTKSYMGNSALQNQEDMKETLKNIEMLIENRDSDRIERGWSSYLDSVDYAADIKSKYGSAAKEAYSNAYTNDGKDAAEAAANKVFNDNIAADKAAAEKEAQDRKARATEEWNNLVNSSGGKIDDAMSKAGSDAIESGGDLNAAKDAAAKIVMKKIEEISDNSGNNQYYSSGTTLYKKAIQDKNAKYFSGLKERNLRGTNAFTLGEIVIGKDTKGNKVIMRKASRNGKDGYVMAENLIPKGNKKIWENYKSLLLNTLAYSSGGMNYSTGMAMLHGTSTKPESVLNAEDTKLFREQLFGNGNYSLRNAIQAVWDMQDNISNASNGIIDNSTNYNFGGVEIRIDTGVIGNDYEASRAADTIMDKLTALARKSQNIGVTRR